MANYSSAIRVQSALDNANYPAKKTDLIKYAQNNGASGDVLDTIKALPDGIVFDTPADVSSEVGKLM